MTTSHGRVIRASEIGEYVYCHRAWWLHRVRKIEPADRRKLEAGIAQHAEYGRAVRRAATLYHIAWVLLATAMGLAVVGVSALLLLPH